MISQYVTRWFKKIPRPRYTNWRQVLLVYGVLAILSTCLNGFPTGQTIDYQVVRPLEFWLRSKLGMAPNLDPRIKLISYDDNTVSKYQATDILMEEWATLLARLDERKPAVILADKLFDLPRGRERFQVAAADYIRNIDTRIVPGAFVTKVNILGRTEINRFNKRNLLSELADNPSDLSWLTITEGRLYGAADNIVHAFDEFGHLVYWGDGRIEPFIRFGDDTGIFHLALLASTELKIKGRSYYASGSRVPVDRDGQVHVNLLPRRQLQEISWSFRTALEAAYGQLNGPSSGEKIDQIEFVQEGDYVFILPAMYTGSGDWVHTPIGVIEGGYVQAAVLNSVLTNSWLKPLNAHWILPGVTVAIGIGIGAFLWGASFWLGLILITVLLCLAGLSAFVFFGVIVSWLVPTASAALGALFLFGLRTGSARIEHVRIETELQTTALVQKTFFPQTGPTSEHLLVRGRFLPASECSGDWWGHFTTRSGTPFVIIGDAMGHGTPAALVTGMAYTSCNSYYQMSELAGEGAFTPAGILNHFNRILHQAMGGSFYMTMFVIAFDFESGELVMANAGHVSPILIPQDPNDSRIKRRHKAFAKISPMTPVTLQVPGSPLGESNNTDYKDLRLPMRPGDKFFAYTDALIECPGSEGSIWTPKDLNKHLLANAHLSGVEFHEAFCQVVDLHYGNRTLKDDQTIVIAEVSQSWAGS